MTGTMEDRRTKRPHTGETPNLKTDTAALIWQATVDLQEFTASEVARTSGCAEATVKHTITRWEVEGFLRKCGKGRNGAQAYTHANEQKRPFGPKETRIWRAVRRLKTFSFRDVAVTASIPGDEVCDNEAETFIRTLLNAGYVKIRTKAVAGKAPARYALKPGKDTGPKPPFKRRVTVFVDPNTGHVELPEEYR